MDYETYEKECAKIKATNKKLLKIFKTDLIESGLSDKTIKRHISNLDFYLNEFLLLEEAHPMEDGISMIGEYLGDFYIYKCMWSTPANIKTTAASIKKFYKSMLAHKKIEKSAYEFLCAFIKDSMEFWQEECAEFNDLGSDFDPFAGLDLF